MKVVAVLGSPHTNGNGAQALNSFIKGLEENNHECVTYNLSRLNIRNCLGCRKCIENGAECVLKDDYTEIFEEIKNADLVIICSPIYINQVNGYTKTFLDRCYPLTDQSHKPRFGKRNLIMMWTYGVPLPFIFNRYIRATSKSLKAMGLNIKKNIIINGCTTLDRIANNEKIQKKMYRLGKNV